MTERQLSKVVVQLAEALGWRVMTISHTKAAGLRSHSGIGFPDILAIRGRRLLVAELKSDRGKLRPGQGAWLDAFAEAGGEAYLWRPPDWTSGGIEEVLKREQGKHIGSASPGL